MFNELIEAGRNLLRAQPMNKNDCVQWSDAARSKIGECYGLESPKTVDFTKARWGTPTCADSDPSIEMAQIGANLRRELRILEKFLAQEGGAPGRQPNSAATKPASLAGDRPAPFESKDGTPRDT